MFCAADARQYLVEEMAVPMGTEPGAFHGVRAFANGINRQDGSPQQVAGGLVPPETARMEVRRPGGEPSLTPVVADGTFVLVVPQGFQEDVTVVLYDAQDRVILEQPMRFPG